MSRWSTCYQMTHEEHAAIQDHLKERYERMREEDELATLHIDADEFSYAVIPRRDVAPDRVLAQKFVNTYAYGFTTETGGERISFVLAEVPDPYRPIVAAHEYVENRQWDHEAATERELGKARELDCLDGYLDWVEEHYPQRMPDLPDR